MTSWAGATRVVQQPPSLFNKRFNLWRLPGGVTLRFRAPGDFHCFTVRAARFAPAAYSPTGSVRRTSRQPGVSGADTISTTRYHGVQNQFYWAGRLALIQPARWVFHTIMVVGAVLVCHSFPDPAPQLLPDVKFQRAPLVVTRRLFTGGGLCVHVL